MSKLLFLPDRNGREKESEGAGLVRLSADTSEMAALAKRMVIRQETGEITPDAAYQGAMALALLLDSWQGTDVRLAVRTIDAQKSRFASWVMAARPMEQRNQPIRLLMLVKDQQEALLGLVDEENGLTLAAQMGDIWDMLPERATWVNREEKCFRSPLPLLNELADYHGVPTVADTSYSLLQIGAYGGLVMGAVFGIFFAMAMFAYLTNPRATQGFHSMPVRRETLYATNYLTGLVCMVSALVLAFALAGITAACFGALDLTALGTALLAAVLSVLFFYSFAVLCMMFTGQILAAPVFYGILNFLAVGMEYLVRTFAGNFLYGYSGYSAPETFAFLSPAWELVCVLDVSNVARVDRILSDGTYQVIRGGEYMLSGLGMLGIYAAVGIVLAVLGLLVYRRRASEATGSIVTVAWARPIFKYGVAVCAAFSLGQLIYFLVFGLNLHNGQYSLPGTIACMLFTGLLGYFAAEMLLHKSFRVWRTGRVGALVFSAVLVCFGVAMSLDLTGYEGYTPDAEEVEFVSVYLSSNGDYLSCKLDEPESIERTLAAHRAMIADKARQLSYARTTYETPADAPVDSYLYFTVTYALTDGRVVRRNYGDCRAFFREHASFPCRTFRPACRGILFPVSSFYLTIGGSLPLRTALRVRAYQAVKHVVHSPVNTPTRDAGEVDARGLLRGVTQALPDQLHRIAGLLHQCGPGVAHHVGRQGYGKARKTPDAEGVPVHALERGFLGGFPVPVPGGGTLHAPEVVEEGEHPGGAAAAVALHKGGGLGGEIGGGNADVDGAVVHLRHLGTQSGALGVGTLGDHDQHRRLSGEFVHAHAGHTGDHGLGGLPPADGEVVRLGVAGGGR